MYKSYIIRVIIKLDISIFTVRRDTYQPNKHKTCAIMINGNNLMTYAAKLKVDRGIPGEPMLYLSGKYYM